MSLRTQTVCDIAGITYRQLDYWLRTGLIIPACESTPGSGNRRSFTEREAILVACIAEVMRVAPLNGEQHPAAGPSPASALWAMLAPLRVRDWPDAVVLDAKGIHRHGGKLSGLYIALAPAVERALAAIDALRAIAS